MRLLIRVLHLLNINAHKCIWMHMDATKRKVTIHPGKQKGPVWFLKGGDFRINQSG